MTVAPVLRDAIWVFFRLLIVSVLVSVLTVGSQAKKTEDAKRTQCKTRCGRGFSHFVSPIVSIRHSANGHNTVGF
jgi:hypothetical protein